MAASVGGVVLVAILFNLWPSAPLCVDSQKSPAPGAGIRKSQLCAYIPAQAGGSVWRGALAGVSAALLA